MSEEDVIGKLGRFSPAAVDRDALLFAAGRASVRPAGGWKWATAALLVTQLVTLGLWLGPRSEPPAPGPEVKPMLPDDPPAPAPDPYSLIALTRNDEPPPAPDYTPNPTRAPLMAFTRNFQP